MLVLQKTATKFVKGSLAVVLLVHICSSCSTKAQGFKFENDDVKELPKAAAQEDNTSSKLKIEKLSNDFSYNIEEPTPEVNRRDGKAVEDDKPETDSGAPRFARKIASPKKPVVAEAGKLKAVAYYIRDNKM